ncbi:MAG: aminoglycoside N(3)-acetyltransferase [Actinomycetota bacterium]
MSEEDQIKRTQVPITVTSLVRDLRALGVMPGDTVLAHSSLSAIGWVVGGAHAVVLALEKALSPGGTLVMPSHSNGLTDPASWVNPPVPAPWFETIREEMPAFDPAVTPTRGMGAVVDCFRSQPGVLRSNQPRDSFCALGPHATTIVAGHDLAFGLGESSPLARLYDLDARVLLLGVGHESNTSLHLAEYRAEWPGKKLIAQGAPVMVDGQRRWERFQDVDLDSDDFEALGADFERDSDSVRLGRVGLAAARLMDQRAAIDYAVTWIPAQRGPN